MGGNPADAGPRQLKVVVVVDVAVVVVGVEGLAGLAGIVSSAGPAEFGVLGGGGICSFPEGSIERGVVMCFVSFLNGSGGGGRRGGLLLLEPSPLLRFLLLLKLLSSKSVLCRTLFFKSPGLILIQTISSSSKWPVFLFWMILTYLWCW